MNRPLGPVDEEEREKFLASLADGATVTLAARELGRNRRRFYEIRDEDDAFREAWDDAIEQGTEVLVEEARRRAVEGVIYSEQYDKDGNLVGQVRRYSDTLLIFLLKSRDPARFNRFEVTGAGGGPVGVKVEVDEQSARDVLRVLAEQGIVQPGATAAPHPEGE